MSNKDLQQIHYINISTSFYSHLGIHIEFTSGGNLFILYFEFIRKRNRQSITVILYFLSPGDMHSKEEMVF